MSVTYTIQIPANPENSTYNRFYNLNTGLVRYLYHDCIAKMWYYLLFPLHVYQGNHNSFGSCFLQTVERVEENRNGICFLNKLFFGCQKCPRKWSYDIRQTEKGSYEVGPEITKQRMQIYSFYVTLTAKNKVMGCN